MIDPVKKVSRESLDLRDPNFPSLLFINLSLDFPLHHLAYSIDNWIKGVHLLHAHDVPSFFLLCRFFFPVIASFTDDSDISSFRRLILSIWHSQ
jgi:hypothetical protein